MGKADLDALLDAAVGAVGGSARPGQQEMAKAVATALEQGDPPTAPTAASSRAFRSGFPIAT